MALDAFRHAVRWLLAGTAFATASAYAASAQAAGGQDAALAPTPAEMATARTHLSAALDDHRDVLPEAPLSIKVIGTARWSGTAPGRLLLVPIRVTSSGAANGLCGLVTLSTDLSAAHLVDGSRAPWDLCKRIDAVVYADANGSGASDVVEILEVPSNRYRVDVAVAVVYLRDEHSAGGYCYSEQASDAVMGTYPLARAVFEKTFARERARLGLPRFECAPA